MTSLRAIPSNGFLQAVSKGREDLAREALREKRRHQEAAEGLLQQTEDAEAVVVQYHADIHKLEEKLQTAREKHRVLVQRAIAARKRKQAESTLRRAETSSAFQRFDDFEQRIDRLESEAELVNQHRPEPGLASTIDALQGDDDIERELAAIKARCQG